MAGKKKRPILYLTKERDAIITTRDKIGGA